MSGISANMIVKNEDKWVYFAIMSLLPYVDEFLITDTGSTDNTLSIIKSISSPKIIFDQTISIAKSDVTAIRQKQLDRSKGDWIWIIDADEIYTTKLAKECLSAIKENVYEGILVRRYDLLGDVYHRQSENVGTYEIFGHTGHILIRLINHRLLKNLSYAGDYPLEGFFDREGKSILSHDAKLFYATTNYLYHAMYLRRSSLGGNLKMFNRSKYKIETGNEISDVFPEVFSAKYPKSIQDPLTHRGLVYELLASLITPIKNLKRKL